MANLLQYTDKSRSIDEKLKLLLSDIEHAYQNGEIRTETEYYYRVKTAVAEFQETLSRPEFKFRPADFVPVSDDYNSMVSEAVKDMEYIINDCRVLEKALDDSYTDGELGRQMMRNRISYLSQETDMLIKNIKNGQPEGTSVFTELFNDKKAQGNRTADDACYMDAGNGLLMLGYQFTRAVNISGIEIDNDASNGLPGNTHCVDTKNSELHFLGQEGLHTDISCAYDGDTESWYEYELFTVPESVKEQCGDYGFAFAEGVQWTGKPPLVLKLKAKAGESYKCSWFSIKPYLPEIKGASPASLSECVIITDDNNAYRAGQDISFNDLQVFMFPGKAVKEVRMTFIQNKGYAVKAGHNFFAKVNSKSMSIFQDFDTSDIYSRVEGSMPSVGLLGVSYDPETQWVDYNSGEAVKPEYAKDGLFKKPESTIEKAAGQEVIDAVRYMIGIRNMELRSYIFHEYGYYVSQSYSTNSPIDSVVLEAEEYIPGTDPEIIKYFITFDGGTNWHSIYPASRSYAGPYRLTVNNDTIANLMTTKNRQERTKNITLLSDAYSFMLKIEMRAPADIENTESSSPIVHSYRLTVQTGGAGIEY